MTQGGVTAVLEDREEGAAGGEGGEEAKDTRWNPSSIRDAELSRNKKTDYSYRWEINCNTAFFFSSFPNFSLTKTLLLFDHTDAGNTCTLCAP